MATQDPLCRTEIRDNMRITRHQPITMNDGLTLRADIYRPMDENAKCPVILNYGICGKSVASQQGYPLQGEKMVADHPEIF